MNISRRHHYIPQFFIKNFADSDGLVYIFNKQEFRLVTKKQSPKSVFFENDRNSVNIAGTKTDSLEKLYAELDAYFAGDIKEILKTKIVTPEALTSVVSLASLLKWRIPGIDERFEGIKNDASLEDLSIEIRLKGTRTKAEKDAIAHLEKSDLFKETKRILLSIRPFLEGEKLLKIHNNSFIYTNDHFPAVLGDCPIIERFTSDFRDIGEFVFPLNTFNTFIYKVDTKCNVTNDVLFCIHRDLAIFHYSNKYVACRNKEYLLKISELYSVYIKKTDPTQIASVLFNYIT